ncbi:hypothetical protein BDY17DRAFT_315218 [Neohortaea acidophila]|uniref:Enoyl reductase (ER) domain-containing protein n=1 Tax=Neohortaea acidophila TaxID=245834 RepID=A0A6A6Q245_9PEZI|nr:uncharacterized protein BDY17DRAFT_315218 [Neohortaea acidophila]KAF2486365.1 hypothetical protein BDY17DRAFT_315218 [Neohortaea acidophila]
MKAVRVTKEGSSTTLRIDDIPKPSAGPGELLVEIKASFVQPADILNSKGNFASTTYPRTLGKDFSGIVVSGPSEWLNKAVYGTSGATFSFTEDGAQAEFAVLKQGAVALMPRNLSFAQAAALGTPWTTGMTTLLRARAKPTDVVMVLGANGSVGSSVIQIARRMGCRTIGVGRRGADIDSSRDPLLSKAKELSDGLGPNVVVDTVGNLELTNAAVNVMASKGRMSIISAPRQGNRELPLDLLDFYRRQIELVGCNTAAESQEEMARLLNDLTPDFESGRLVPAEENTMNLIDIEQAADAYSGKIKRAVIVFR